jgi:phage gp46-like protein
MSDIGLFLDGQTFDVLVSANDLVADDGLETAIILSLFTDRRADDSDELPDAEQFRRGWWADSDDDRIGSKLWLLSRSKELVQIRALAEQYARESLQWLISDGIVESISVVAVIPLPGVIGLAVEIQRPFKDPAKYQFNYTWAAQEARSS